VRDGIVDRNRYDVLRHSHAPHQFALVTSLTARAPGYFPRELTADG
jgi:hypothetical protein